MTHLLAQFPAVVLLGPPQVGKTTLAAGAARRADAVYLDLELPSAQCQLDDPETFLLAHRQRLMILDEVQHVPELFAVLHGGIGQRRRDDPRDGVCACGGASPGRGPGLHHPR